MISAVFSRFSGGFSGYRGMSILSIFLIVDLSYRLGEKKVVIFWLDAKVFEYRVGPEALHVILCKTCQNNGNTYRMYLLTNPVLNLSMSNRIVNTIACYSSEISRERVFVVFTWPASCC